jgi:phenylalanyl-tRNA synthetase beta chain
MQFPESWLRTFVNTDWSTEQIAHELTMAGLEVEEVNAFAPPFTGVIAARIEAVEPHPDADKLRICRVNNGQTTLQIVCGAPNAAVGLVVPLAQVGAVMPNDMKIGAAKMRGVESLGMLCSARELGLSQDHAGLMVLDETTELGKNMRQVLNLDDQIFTLKLTPNRADCLSILGVARELAALAQSPLKPLVSPQVKPTLSDVVKVNIHAPDLCGRFMGQVIKGVNAHAKTPAWVVERLERAGQRSVSALVDLSNYLMLERGRPTHVFDLNKLAQPELNVRWGKSGETLKLLNGESITLDEKLGVIDCDGEPESLAGIMGGDHTAVSLDTTEIYVEAAFWWPDSVAGRTRRLKLNSEAAHRFERGVDFESIPQDIDALVSLIVEVCGGQVGPVQDLVVSLPKRHAVNMRLSRCQRVLGIPIDMEAVEGVFNRLGLPFVLNGDVFSVTPPAYRFDIEIEEDLIEEVARIIGFENIPANPPVTPAKMRAQPEALRSFHQVRHTVAALDYQEVVNFSFVQTEWERDMIGEKNTIKLLNPIASQMAVMRSMLIPGLLQTVAYNANRQQSRVRVFEAGRVFKRDQSTVASESTVLGVHQPMHVAGVAWGSIAPEQWGLKQQNVDYFDIKNDLEVLMNAQRHSLRFEPTDSPLFHPGRSAGVSLEGKLIGWVGEIHPNWVREFGLSSAPVAFEVILDALVKQNIPRSQEVSRQPVVQRDLALWVAQDKPVQTLLDSIYDLIKKESLLSVVRRVELFDVWRPTDQTETKEISIAFRFWLQDDAVTLSDEHVDLCMTKIRSTLETEHHVRQR